LKLNNIVTLKYRLGITQDHWKWHHSKAWVRFLFVFRSNSGSILFHFGNKTRWSKIAIFS